MKHSALCGLLLLFLSACQNTAEQPAPPAGSAVVEQKPAAAPREYKLEGEIVSVDKDNKVAVINHGPIEGYMAAMTMPYPVPDATDLDKIKAGDHITATVYDSEAEARYWVGNIQVGAPPAK